jgi:hypothetical protein
VHAIGGRLRFLDVIPRSTWLSLAGGISVAYVFVHLLPELAAGPRALGGPLEHHGTTSGCCSGTGSSTTASDDGCWPGRAGPS